jgi:hypothetical protein
MFDKISKEINNLVTAYSSQDKVIFRNKTLDINQNNFNLVERAEVVKTVTYIDGGQAEIVSTGNFCLSFIRIFAAKFCGTEKLDFVKHEFYLLTFAKRSNLDNDAGVGSSDLTYYSKIFPVTERFNLLDEDELTISSEDSSIKEGWERAPIAKVANMARRFAELKLAKRLALQDYSDYFLLDGILEPTFKGEETILTELPGSVCGLAKSCSLFTAQGNSPVALFSNLGPLGVWSYFLDGKSYFVKLHENAKHIFRFEGDVGVLPHLLANSEDALFLGYPYGLIFADKMARVSNVEKDSLRMKFLLDKKNEGLLKYLSSSNAHEILDSL